MDGAVSRNWLDDGNWSPSGEPGQEDVAWIDVGAPIPLVDTADALCGGVVLLDGAQIEVQGAALYVVGPGDLDEDGLMDIEEINGSNLDADGDGVPNFAETDSDNDGLPDWWAHKYGLSDNGPFNPYSAALPGQPGHPDSDYDGDTYTNRQEYEAGTDPTNPDKSPAEHARECAVGIAGGGVRDCVVGWARAS